MLHNRACRLRARRAAGQPRRHGRLRGAPGRGQRHPGAIIIIITAIDMIHNINSSIIIDIHCN